MRIVRRLPAAVVFTAWLTFVVAFFLPATNVVEMSGTKPGTPLTGWQAFTSSLEVLAVQPLIVIAEPRTLVFLAFPFVNLAMLLAPVVALGWDDSWLVSWLFVLCGVLPWVFPKDVTGELFVGFYLWDASFFAMAIGCILVRMERRRVYARDLKRSRQ